MNINWAEKNTAELELYFSTDINKGLDSAQYSRNKAQYGENIIDSEMLEQQNFYGLANKKRSVKEMLQDSLGITGAVYLMTAAALGVIGFAENVFIFIPFYIFLGAAAFVLSAKSRKQYAYIYNAARPKALVIRQNKRKKVFIESIVPGDVLLLAKGDIVPADCRIVSANGFSCVGAGEDGKLKIFNKTDKIMARAPDYTVVPLPNIAYAAEVARRGNASAVAVATGENTYAAKKSARAERANKDARAASEYSVLQKHARKISRDFYLVSVAMFLCILVSGILQNRDTASVLLTCLAVSAACFAEQIPVIADYAVIRGMHKLAKSGILMKEPAAVDEINAVDTLIAKKNESFTQDKMRLSKIAGYDVKIENTPEIGYILSCIASCSNAAARSSRSKNKTKTKYTGAAVDVAVFEALEVCGLDYNAIGRVYNKLGKTVTNPQTGIKSAVVVKDGQFNLVCFGEAFNIIERCAAGPRDLRLLREQVGDLYKEHDLVMAAAAKSLTYKYVERISPYDPATESGLTFLGFACFAEPKTSSVFESIDYLKKSGITPVMIAEKDNVYTKSAAVKLGIVKSLGAARVLDDHKINAMGESMFYIQAEKFTLFTSLSQPNRIKLLKALNFRRRAPAITISDVEETALLEERCTAFAPVGAETEILKNRASVITKNLTVSTILKTVRGAVLIYGNISKALQFSSAVFTSQYLLALLAMLTGCAYILSPAQIIWAGVPAGFMLAAAVCAGEENSNWHITRRKIKEYKKPKKYTRTVFISGLVYGLLIFAAAAASFFACLVIRGAADTAAAQTAAFTAYVAACVSTAAGIMRGARFFGLKAFENKVFAAVSAVNLTAVPLAVFVPRIRDFLGFGAPGAAVFAMAALIGLCPYVIAGFIRKIIFFE